MEEFGILGFGIRNPRDCLEFHYMGRQGDALPRYPEKLEFIADFISFIWAALLAMKMALGEIF